MTVKLKPQKLYFAWFILLVLTLIWGTSFILIKRGLDSFSAGEVGSLRMFSAGIVLIPAFLMRMKQVTFRQAGYIFIVGFVGSFIPSFLFAKAETQLASAMAGTLNALTPLFVLLIGAFLFRQAISKRMAVGLAIGFAGTLILITTGETGLISNLNYYAFFVLLATMCYGLNVNIIKYRLTGIGAITITSFSMVMVLPFAAYYLFVESNFMLTMMTVPEAKWSLFYVVLLGVLSTAIAMVLFNKLVQLISPVFASMVTYLIPIVAVGWGLIDGEVLLPLHYIGMATILGGVYLTNKR